MERRLDDAAALLVGFSDDPAMAHASVREVQTALRAYIPHIDVVAVDAHDWNADHFARGTWMAPRPGQLHEIEALHDIVHANGIQFAGADLCIDAYGTIEGAVVSGKRAAARLITSAASHRL
jgi:monoamine oxidase